MLNVESGNHLKEMSVNSHGYVKFGPGRKSFPSAQSKVKFLFHVYRVERRGTATTSAWSVSVEFGEMNDC